MQIYNANVGNVASPYLTKFGWLVSEVDMAWEEFGSSVGAAYKGLVG